MQLLSFLIKHRIKRINKKIGNDKVEVSKKEKLQLKLQKLTIKINATQEKNERIRIKRESKIRHKFIKRSLYPSRWRKLNKFNNKNNDRYCRFFRREKLYDFFIVFNL